MQIREGRLEDFNELKSFYTRMNEVINERNNGYDPNNPVFPTDKMIQDAILMKNQIVGIEDGKIVAASIVYNQGTDEYQNVKWNTDVSYDKVWIFHALRVLPEYENRGFAKQMIAYVIDLAAERGIKSIRLDVLEGYYVEKIYSRFDFKYVDTLEILYEDIGYPRRFRLLERVI